MRNTFHLIFRELLTAPRRSRFYLKRFLLLTGGGLILFLGLATHRGTGSTGGLIIFQILSISGLVALGFTAAVTAGSLLVREKEERTLGVLFLTQLSPVTLVLGKMATALFVQVMGILSLVPVFLLTISLGGISTPQVLTGFALLLATCLFAASIGIFCGALADTERIMTSWVVLFLFLFYIAVPVLLAYLEIHSLYLWSFFSPFAAAGLLDKTKQLHATWAHCGLVIALSFPFLTFSLPLLRRVNQGRPRRFWGTLLSTGKLKTKWWKRWFKPKPIRGNPVLWREFEFKRGGYKMISLWLGIFLFGLFASSLYVFLMENAHLEQLRILPSLELVDSIGYLGFFIHTVRTVLTALQKAAGYFIQMHLLYISYGAFFTCTLMGGLTSVNRAANVFSEEKSSRTIDLLLTTTLSDREIVRGKFFSILKSILPWLLFAIPSGLLILSIESIDWNWIQAAFILLSEFGAMTVGYTGLSFWISLRFKRNIAFPVCCLVFVLWNTFGRYLLLLFLFARSSGVPMLINDIVFHSVMGIFCLVLVFKRFRRIALKG